MYTEIFPRLYSDNENGSLFAYLVLKDAPNEPDSISLEDAVSNKDGFDPVFVYTAQSFAGKKPEEFVPYIDNILSGQNVLSRAIIWCPIDADAVVLGINKKATQTERSCAVPLVPNRNLEIANTSSFTLNPESACLVFAQQQAPKRPFCFSGEFLTDISVYDCVCFLSGDKRGTLSFGFSISFGEFLNQFNPGMRLVYSDAQVDAFYPFLFLQKNQENKYLQFTVSINPCDVFNRLHDPVNNNYGNHTTHLTLIDTSDNRIDLISFYQTVYGDYIRLVPEIAQSDTTQPARFCFVWNPAVIKQQQLCPEGDFIVSSDFGIRGDLLCGLNGTESIAFQKGDRLRFLSGCPGYIKEIVSGPPEVGQDYNPDAPRLFDTYQTSWCAFIGGGKPPEYCSQPRGFSFYGSAGDRPLLFHEKPAFPVSVLPVPLFPYNGGDKNPRLIESCEEHAVSVDRKRLLNQAAHPRLSALRDGETKIITTPGGQIVELVQSAWKTISLAQAESPKGQEKIYFENPDADLVNAFQSPNLFLVVANGLHLGDYVDGIAPVNKRAFHNSIHVEDWLLKSNIGEGSQYGQYTGIMIVKGCRGKLYDPDNESASLVLNTGAWCARSVFSSPVTGKDGPDPSQQPMLANWLLDYFKKATEERETAYFDYFNTITQDQNWQGILFLNLPLDTTNLPLQMAGILSGIPPDERLSIHHWGVTLNTIKQNGAKIEYEKTSSLFGLIYYRDKGIPADTDVSVVSPDYGDYNFKLLTLKVLFESARVKNFQCYAQLAVNKFLGMSVGGMGQEGNPYNAILMKGTFQDCNGASVFSLRSEGQTTFLFPGNAIAALGLTGVEMTTQDMGKDVFRFGLEGVIDFAGGKPDVFSFGTEASELQGGAGLYFTGIGLTMRRNEGVQVFEAVNTGVKFNPIKSNIRSKSLYHNFRLEIEEMVFGSDNTTLKSLGYTLLPAPFSADILSGEWYGLSCMINLGTLGELAGKAGLTARLLIGWKPGGSEGCVALQLPGIGGSADFLSIQNILKLSVGSLRLGYFTETQVFFIMLNDIALKVFGIAKLPPAGSTALYLYGASGDDAAAPIGWYAQYRREEK